MRSFREPNTHHSATASCPASTSTLSGQRCSTHAGTRVLTSQKPPRASGPRHRPPPHPAEGRSEAHGRIPPGTFTRCVPFPLNPRWRLAQGQQCLLNTCQQVGPHLCGDVWCKRRVYSGLQGKTLTTCQPRLPKTASSQVGVFSLSDTGWRCYGTERALFCCILAVNEEWQARQHRGQLRRVSELEFQIRPGTVGVAGTCTQYKRAKPPRSSRCPTPTTGSSFPISCSESASPSLAHARVCLPRHRSPPSIMSVSTQAANAFQRQLLPHHPSLALRAA